MKSEKKRDMRIPITGSLQLPILVRIFNPGDLLRQSVGTIEKKLQIFNTYKWSFDSFIHHMIINIAPHSQSGNN